MDAATPLGAWASIRAFFTPATLFLVLNLVIGTIVLTSRSRDQRRRRHAYYPHDEQLHQEHPPPEQQHESHYGYMDPPQQQEYAPPPPARTSSVMDRLRSIGLYRFRSGDFPPEYASPPAAAADSMAPVDEAPTEEQGNYARSRSEPAPARATKRAAPSRMRKSSSEVRKAEASSAPAARVVHAPVAEDEDVLHASAADSFTPPTPPRQQEDYYQEEEQEYVPPLRPAPLARAPSVLERLRSFSLYSFRSGDLAAVDSAHDAAAAAVAEEKKQQAAHYGRTRSEPKKQPAAQGRMSKSSSAAPKKAAAAQPDVDARADDFINNFRQQLQLQRLNSLLNGGGK